MAKSDRDHCAGGCSCHDHFCSGGRNRDYEHHAGVSHGAHLGGGYAQGGGCDESGRTNAISHGIGLFIHPRRRAGCRSGFRVDVLAAADGVVSGRRDGMVDRLVQSDSARAQVKDRECGNGVRIDHGSGWQTQYCHMRRGSVQVRNGDAVRAGDVLGQVGYSGRAAFPHVHITVRKDGRVVDPFEGVEPGGTECSLGAQPLWQAEVLKTLGYRKGQLLDAGFAGGKITLGELEKGTVQGFVPSPDSPALVAWGWAINLQKGDKIFAVLAGPEGELVRNTVTLESNKAHYFLLAGKKRKSGRWPSGRYVAFFGVLRDGKPILRAGRPFVMP